MNKIKLFRATGTTFNAKSHKSDLAFYGQNVTSVRQGVNDKETVRIRVGVASGSMHERLLVYANLIGAMPTGSTLGTHNYMTKIVTGEPKTYAYTKGNSSKDNVFYYKTEKQAKEMLAKWQDWLTLCRKVATASEVTVTDAQYAATGGKLLTSDAGLYTYLIPYDAKAATEARQHVQEQANVQQAQAEAQQAQAEADIATEEAKQKTTAGKTLRIVGIAAVAALVIGVVVFVVARTKKM